MEDKTMGAFTICHLHNSHMGTDVYIQPSLMSILYAFMDLKYLHENIESRWIKEELPITLDDNITAEIHTINVPNNLFTPA